MNAAIYARKSRPEHDADADAKSVQRQIENARTFASSKGWRVSTHHVYSDDAISGAETKKLVNRQRLLAALAADPPPFQILIMRDASRFSRRDGDEAFGELKRLAQAGVEIWFYQDATRFTFGSFGANVVGFVRAEMNAEYRRQIARFTTEAMIRKFDAGHVVGGRVFGYDNVRVNGHTERRINATEAAVIRRIFGLSAKGMGYTRIAKQLNAEGVVSPRPRVQAQAAWTPETVNRILHRRLYRGEVVWNKTQRRGPDGTTVYAPRPASEWRRLDRPEWQIVSAEAWHATQTRLVAVRQQFLDVAGPAWTRRRRDSDSPYLLSGFLRCAVCGGSMGVVGNGQYGCVAYHKRGRTRCANAVRLPIARLDQAVIDTLREKVFDPMVALVTLTRVLARLAPRTLARDLTRHRRDVATLDTQIARLATAIATGGPMTALLDELRTRQEHRATLRARIAESALEIRPVDRVGIERKVRQTLSAWQAKLAGRLDHTRHLLRQILVGPITLTPEGRTYRFEGEAALGVRLLGAVGLPTYPLTPG